MAVTDTFVTPNPDDSPQAPDAFRGQGVEHSEEILHLDSIEMPFTASGDQQNDYSRRFLTLFREAGRNEHFGGSGVVEKVRNAQGEVFALKRISYVTKTKLIDEDRYKKTVAAQREAFRKEYDNQQRLASFKGFPRLYGYGFLEGEPVILMEWIDGKTLSAVKNEMALNPQTGQWSPKNIAQLGVALYALLARMDCLQDDFVHRDISLNNIMFKTTERSVAEQFEQGNLDLYLIDFGSSSSTQVESPSFTVMTNVIRKGTPEYAPPEMLSTDLPNLPSLRGSTSIDVYAVSSILYELMCGRTPYALNSKTDIQSYYRYKIETAVPNPTGVHRGATSRAKAVLDEETEGLYNEMREDYGAEFDETRFFESLRVVDQQLGAIIMQGLAIKQDERPTAEKMSEMLETFSENYFINMERRYSWERIIPFSKPLDTSNHLKKQLRITAPELGQPTILRAPQVPAGAIPGYGAMPDGVAPIGTSPALRDDAVSGAKAGGVGVAVIALSFALAFFVSALVRDFTFSFGSADTLLTMNIPLVVVALVTLAPVLFSLLFSWVATKPGAKLFVGTSAFIVTATMVLAFTLTAKWQTPSASAGIGFIFILEGLIVFIYHFYFYLAKSHEPGKGTK